jgi:hypothetical protein
VLVDARQMGIEYNREYIDRIVNSHLILPQPSYVTYHPIVSSWLQGNNLFSYRVRVSSAS